VPPVITSVEPRWAVPGGRVTIRGREFPVTIDGPPAVAIRRTDAPADVLSTPARVVSASGGTFRLVVPEGVVGPVRVRVGEAEEIEAADARLDVASVLTTGVHQVDNPAFDAAGRLWVTQSGGRETKVSVPLYRVGRNGVREPLSVEIGNPTSLALAPDGAMFVSSRFDGQVFRVGADDRAELYASELGVATGLACAPDGTLYVGDRSGTVFRIGADRRVENIATLPGSVAAFHLAYGPDGAVYVAAPTLATHDAVYRLVPGEAPTVVTRALGRPQGLAFDASGVLYVVDALAGSAGLYRVNVTDATPNPELVLTAPALVGLAFDPLGGLVVASSDTVWRLDSSKPFFE
jgi:sugar lactone lactonase YvrE